MVFNSRVYDGRVHDGMVESTTVELIQRFNGRIGTMVELLEFHNDVQSTMVQQSLHMRLTNDDDEHMQNEEFMMITYMVLVRYCSFKN